MLSAVEIMELEKRVFKYRLKQRIHYIIISVIILLIGAIAIYSYPTIIHGTDTNTSLSDVQTTAETIKPLDTNSTSIQEQPLNVPDVNIGVKKYTPPIVMNEQENQTLFLQLPTINRNKAEKKSSYIPETPEKKTNFGIQEEELDNKVLMRKMPTIDDENFYRNKEDKVDTALLPPPLLDEPKPKGLIKIETHEVNSVQYLKDKFEKTHNITFALMLAEEYYAMKNYTECNKWALMANNVDPDSEKSWIWFAKSKVKLGHKEDAVLALQAYLKSNKSKAAQSLLNQISVGEVID
ncbi:putative transformation system protein [Sulfurospirillum diekertiae]|uniref:Transformation system protein n=1 Tax=Sulfurospirillum diekertiae TaxID=1854492 RepID=A0A290HUR1_9BACT|nr:CDC27 family protein [Sulfurospirillum diekertiae]ATB69576.1 putative transformation system protein [Sulfurospirillum diekertiae]